MNRFRIAGRGIDSFEVAELALAGRIRMVRTVTPTKPERLLHSPCPDRSTSRRR